MDRLIELVRRGIRKNFQYLSIDSNNKVYISDFKPVPKLKGWGRDENTKYLNTAQFICIGIYELTCDWKNTLLDLKLIQSKGIH